MFSFKNTENTLLIDNDQKDMATKHGESNNLPALKSTSRQGKQTGLHAPAV